MRLFLFLSLAPFLNAANLQPVSELLHRAVQEKTIPGAVVIIQQHGEKVFEEAAGYADLENHRLMKVNDVFMIASSTKPFAATTVMTLVDKGKLSLDDPISKYFPHFRSSSTIRQSLSHTSGIVGNDGSPAQLEGIRNFDRSLKDAVEIIIHQPLAYRPVEKWSYGGSSFCVVGRIVELITGMDFEAYMGKVLLEPLALKDTVYLTSREDLMKRVAVMYRKKDGEFQKAKAVMELGRPGPRPNGLVLVPGGIYSPADDVIAFLQMHLDGGAYPGKRILSEASVAEMRKKQTGKLSAEYGLGWMRTKIASNGDAIEVSHGGAYGTELFVDTQRDMLGAIMTQMPLAETKLFIAKMKETIWESYN